MKKIVGLCLGMLIFISPVLADGVPAAPVFDSKNGGTIKGVIIDDMKELLIGASVLIEGGAAGTVTDANGCFLLQNVKKGNYALKISYVGYLPQTVNVTVRPGQMNSLDTLRLEPNSVQLQEAVVYGSIVRGELKAMNMKKASYRIVDVIASDGIGKLPDRNAGEAVQRIPGVALERDQGEGRFVSVRGLPSQ